MNPIQRKVQYVTISSSKIGCSAYWRVGNYCTAKGKSSVKIGKGSATDRIFPIH